MAGRDFRNLNRRVTRFLDSLAAANLGGGHSASENFFFLSVY